MTVYRYLDANTSHITKHEMEAIAALPSVRVIVHEYGAWVHVPQDIEAEFEEEVSDEEWEEFRNVLDVIRFARSLGNDVNWINFDRDAEVIEVLPTFDW